MVSGGEAASADIREAAVEFHLLLLSFLSFPNLYSRLPLYPRHDSSPL